MQQCEDGHKRNNKDEANCLCNSKKPFIYLENWKFTPYHSLDILGHAKEVFPPSSGFLGVPFPKTKN
jgi:hypothetical protein